MVMKYQLKRTFLSILVFVMLQGYTSLASAWKFEAASFATHNTFTNTAWQDINFRQSYNTTPIIVAIPNTSGGDPSTVRVRDTSTSGFSVSPLEPHKRDGPHVSMSSAYVAVEPGVHFLPDGTVIEAGFIETNKTQQAANVSGVSSWETVSFQYNFLSPPTIIAATQTMNNEVGESGSTAPAVSSLPWLTVAVDGISASGFNVALERSESSQGSVLSNEKIGYIAIKQGASGTFTDNDSQSIQYLGETSAATIRAWSNGDTTHTYGTAFSSAPLSVFSKNSRNNPDGGWLRRNGNTTSTAINLRIDEDTDYDNERTSTAAEGEAAGILSFSKAFDADFPPSFTLDKSLKVISDPVNDTVNPKAIPGAVVEYTLLITNTGYDYSDSNQFALTDTLPADTSLFVSNIPGGSGGPVSFIDGATSSGTSWVYSGLSDSSDSIDFSTDGSDFGYAPTEDGDGVDSSVTHIRLKPQGVFVANPSSYPTAEYKYRVLIK